MSNPNLNRRRLLSLIGQLALSAPFIALSLTGSRLARADEPQAKTIIYEDKYEQWLSEIDMAAQKLAEQTGQQYNPEAIKEYDKKTKENLNNKGYEVKPPNPPTLLQ